MNCFVDQAGCRVQGESASHSGSIRRQDSAASRAHSPVNRDVNAPRVLAAPQSSNSSAALELQDPHLVFRPQRTRQIASPGGASFTTPFTAVALQAAAAAAPKICSSQKSREPLLHLLLRDFKLNQVDNFVPISTSTTDLNFVHMHAARTHSTHSRSN